MRQIDKALQELLKVISGRDFGFLIYGNRYIGHMVFQKLTDTVNSSSPLPADIEATVRQYVDEVYAALANEANTLYPQAYLAQLFKNQKKLTEITNGINTEC